MVGKTLNPPKVFELKDKPSFEGGSARSENAAQKADRLIEQNNIREPLHNAAHTLTELGSFDLERLSQADMIATLESFEQFSQYAQNELGQQRADEITQTIAQNLRTPEGFDDFVDDLMDNDGASQPALMESLFGSDSQRVQFAISQLTASGAGAQFQTSFGQGSNNATNSDGTRKKSTAETLQTISALNAATMQAAFDWLDANYGDAINAGTQGIAESLVDGDHERAADAYSDMREQYVEILIGQGYSREDATTIIEAKLDNEIINKLEAMGKTPEGIQEYLGELKDELLDNKDLTTALFNLNNAEAELGVLRQERAEIETRISEIETQAIAKAQLIEDPELRALALERIETGKYMCAAPLAWQAQNDNPDITPEELARLEEIDAFISQFEEVGFSIAEGEREQTLIDQQIAAQEAEIVELKAMMEGVSDTTRDLLNGRLTEEQQELATLEAERAALGNKMITGAEVPEERQETFLNEVARSTEAQACLLDTAFNKASFNLEGGDLLSALSRPMDENTRLQFMVDQYGAATEGKQLVALNKKIQNISTQTAMTTQAVSGETEDLTLNAPSPEQMARTAEIANNARNYADQIKVNPTIARSDFEVITDGLSAAELDKFVAEVKAIVPGFEVVDDYGAKTPEVENKSAENAPGASLASTEPELKTSQNIQVMSMG